MDISVSGNENENVLTVHVDERLDCSAHSYLSDACDMAFDTKPERILIDLGKTRRIADSGLAMLMMFKDRLGFFKNRILLVNCRPELRRSLSLVNVPAVFRIT